MNRADRRKQERENRSMANDPSVYEGVEERYKLYVELKKNGGV